MPGAVSQRGKKNKKKAGSEAKNDVDRTTTTASVVPSGQEKSQFHAIEDVKMPKLIGFLCRYTRGYETLATMLLILNTYMTPFDCFFNVEDTWVSWLVYACDFVYFVDMIIRLIVEEWRHYTNSRVLVFMYPYKLIYCFIDIISLFPFYYFYYWATESRTTFWDLNLLGCFQLLSLLRMYRIILLIQEIKSVGLLYEMIIFIVEFTLYYVSFILVVAIIYFLLLDTDQISYFTLTRDREKLSTTWAKDFLNLDLVEKALGFFLLTLNFSTVVITTVGYGDIVPYSEWEMFISIFIMLIGAIFMSGIFQSTITSYSLQLDGARFDLFHRLDGIKIALRKAKMGEFFISKVEQYYKCLWTYREGVDKVLFLELLPMSFQEDVHYDICLEMFSKSYLFRGLDEAFLRSVSKIVTIALYTPGMVVFRQSGYANKMFYIIQGECQAMSKHDTSKKAAVLRAGSIIGETNLFFSFPYTISVETRTCCQLMCIDKEELMILFNKYQIELNVLRSKCQAKIQGMYYFYEKKGEDPVCWVQVREEAQAQFLSTTKVVGAEKANKEPEGTTPIFDRNPQWPVCSMRWGYGFNDKITEDVILDANEYVIFNYPCEDKVARKNHMTPYTTCVVPEVLSSEIRFIQIWNVSIVISTLLHCFSAPYCFAFNQSSTLENLVCEAGDIMEYMIAVLYMVDVVIEIIGGAPVAGLYYKFRDGWRTRRTDVLFYFDLASAIPLVFLFQIKSAGEYLEAANVVLKSLKLLKAFRYLNFMINVHPKQIFWFRLVQTCLAIIYGTHFIACVVFSQVCKADDNGIRDCTKGPPNWLYSYEIGNEDDNGLVPETFTAKYLSVSNPYLISFFYASATLTSAGFGDFTPQTSLEFLSAIMFTLVGFFLINYYTSVLTSALSCVVKPRLEFQQKLVAVQTFMKYYDLPESLRKRVTQYYELQQQVRHGINLPHGIEHFLFDAPTYLKDDYLYTDNVNLLDGIPIFTKVEPKFIIKMADVMRRFLIPPNVMFHYKGEVRRAMYIIRNGSCGVYDESFESPKYVLEASCHFGIRDLLFGEPSHYNIRSLSYCYLYEITYDQLNEVFEEDAELLDLIDDEKKARHDEIEDLYDQYNRIERVRHSDALITIPSWIHFRPTKNDRGRQGRHFLEYKMLFDRIPGGKLFKWFLQPATIHPVGSFAKMWTCFMSGISCLTLVFLFLETFMYMRFPAVRLIQWILDLFFYVDVYIKLHWGYYMSNTGLLISHPLKAAGLYVFEGTFVSDVVFCTPLELILFVTGSCNFFGYGKAASWFTKLRWIRFIQVKRIPQVFSIAHAIFVKRTFILLLLFVSLTVVMCSVVGSVAIFIACPWEANDWKDGDENRLPACRYNHWTNRKFESEYQVTENVLKNPVFRWIFGIYYVSQVVLVIGFGDMITLNPPELYLLILMSIFGFVFMRCVIADMTAAEVDSDEIRFRYTDSMQTLMHILRKEKVGNRLTSAVHDHLMNTWKLSKGLQPGRLFNDLHPALESDIFRCYAGGTLKKVVIFRDFAPNVLRTLCLYLKKLHFLKGERIMRFGNLEYEMFIIVSGKVWICDKLLSYACTLRRNETFGESSMLSFNKRRYSAIAASPVEVFQISRTDFDALVERYPKVSQIMSALLNNGEFDYFERKIYAMIDRMKELTGEERDRHIDLLNQKSDDIRAVVSIKEVLSTEEAGVSRARVRNTVAYLWSRFISYGTDDEGLAFIYFVARRRQSTKKLIVCPLLIHPNCTFIKFYYACVYILCLICPCLALFELGFSENLLKKLALDKNYHYSTLDERILFIIHQSTKACEYFLLSFIVIQLFVPYPAKVGYVKSFPAIVIHYVFGLDGMWLDLVASIPWLLFSYSLWVENPWRYILFGSRLIRLVRYYKYYMGKTNDLSISPFRLKVQLSVSTFLLIAHAIACIFYLVSECDETENCPCCRSKSEFRNRQDVYTWTQAFVGNRGITKHSDPSMQQWRWYLRSLYWVITVVSTTGFGDITPQNITEMLVGILCFFCSAFVLAIILSQFTSGMTSIFKAHRDYLYQVKLLLKYLNNVGLSATRLRQSNLYFNVLWLKCRGRMYHEATAILPTTLRIEVCNALYVDVLSKVFMFNVNNAIFLRQVAARVVHSVYLPGVCIVKEGDLGSKMYIVFRGYVSGITSMDTKAMELKKLYQVGDVFGKLPCLFSSEYYRKSYRAEVVTEVLELSSRDVIHLATTFPAFWSLLKAFVANTYDPKGQSDCIFSAQRIRQRNIFDLGEDYQQGVKKEQAHFGKRPAAAGAEELRKNGQPIVNDIDYAGHIETTKDKTNATRVPWTKSVVVSKVRESKGATNVHSRPSSPKSSKKKKNKKKRLNTVAEPVKFLYNRGHRLSNLYATTHPKKVKKNEASTSKSAKATTSKHDADKAGHGKSTRSKETLKSLGSESTGTGKMATSAKAKKPTTSTSTRDNKGVGQTEKLSGKSLTKKNRGVDSATKSPSSPAPKNKKGPTKKLTPIEKSKQPRSPSSKPSKEKAKGRDQSAGKAPKKNKSKGKSPVVKEKSKGAAAKKTKSDVRKKNL